MFNIVWGDGRAKGQYTQILHIHGWNFRAHQAVATRHHIVSGGQLTFQVLGYSTGIRENKDNR